MTHVDTPQTRCIAGVARADITPPIGIYHRMWGAASHDRAEAVHRPLLATAMFLAPPPAKSSRAAEEPLIVIGLDHCILDGAELMAMRTAVGEATGVLAGAVHIALSHTHGSGLLSRSRSHLPGGELIGPYLHKLRGDVARLSLSAQQTAEPATIVYGQGRCSLAAHRDFFDSQRGHYVCGFDPEGPADDTLLVGRLTADSGRVLGIIVNYACHPTTLAWDNRAISPDWIGAMRETVEQQAGAPCLFLQGASGDLGPREGFVGDHAVADRNGREVGYAALSALERLPHAGTRYVYAGPVLSGTWIGTWRHEPVNDAAVGSESAWQSDSILVHLPYRSDLPTLSQTQADRERWQAEEHAARLRGDEAAALKFRAQVEQMTRQIARLETLPPGKAYPYPVRLSRLGNAVWIFAPGELYHVFQTTLRERVSPMPVVISTVTDDWQPGYLPARASYGKGIYQDTISPLAPGSLEMLIDAVAASPIFLPR